MDNEPVRLTDLTKDFAVIKPFYERLFALVTPERRRAHWKDEINQTIDYSEIGAVEVTLSNGSVWCASREDLADAVEFFTATKATIKDNRRQLKMTVTADGYRKGPAA